jgi:hypothetical protein
LQPGLPSGSKRRHTATSRPCPSHHAVRIPPVGVILDLSASHLALKPLHATPRRSIRLCLSHSETQCRCNRVTCPCTSHQRIQASTPNSPPLAWPPMLTHAIILPAAVDEHVDGYSIPTSLASRVARLATQMRFSHDRARFSFGTESDASRRPGRLTSPCLKFVRLPRLLSILSQPQLRRFQ